MEPLRWATLSHKLKRILLVSFKNPFGQILGAAVSVSNGVAQLVSSMFFAMSVGELLQQITGIEMDMVLSTQKIGASSKTLLVSTI